jgi:hypothetical protein
MKKFMFLVLLFSIHFSLGVGSQYTTIYITKARSIIKPPEKVNVEFRLFITHLGLIESSNQWKIINPIGCMGKYQFTQATLERLGYMGITPQRFKDNPDIFPESIQEQAMRELVKSNQKQLTKSFQYIGQIINGVRITKAGLLAASHLAGVGGVQRYLTTSHNATDINGTSVQKYLREFQEYQI